MKPSNTEKLIIAMLCDVMRQQDSETELDPDFIQDSINGGYGWAITWKYHGLLSDEADETPPEVSEVCDILTMYSVLKSSFDQLIDTDKEAVIAETSISDAGIRFPGFDGNNETDHMVVARVLIDELDRYTELKGHSYNSHSKTLPKYRRQCAEYDKAMDTTSFGQPLSKESIIKILNA